MRCRFVDPELRMRSRLQDEQGTGGRVLCPGQATTDARGQLQTRGWNWVDEGSSKGVNTTQENMTLIVPVR
jgi:hypothetical protein